MTDTNGPKLLSVVWKVMCALVILSALVYSIVNIDRSPRWLVDDAFIIFRYAENLAVHGELNWNPGEDPVEGYTGAALVWLVAVAIKLGISPVAATHFLGITFYFLGAVFLFVALRGFSPASAVALPLYLTAPFFYIHAWSGLETTIFTAAIIFAIYCQTARHERLFVFAILFLSLTRPEGILLSLILLALFRPFSRRIVLYYLIPFGIYFIWRWAYYGQILPNTFYAKVVAETKENTYDTLKNFSVRYLRFPGLLALIYISWKRLRKNLLLAAGIAVFVAACLLTYIKSHLVMNYQYRFFVPFYPLALLALGTVLLRAKKDIRLVLLSLVLIVPQIVINTNANTIEASRIYASTHYDLLEDEHIRLGNYLRENIPPDEWLVVHADAGSIPYYSKLRTVDFGRLNDEYLSRKNPTREEAVDYLYGKNPGVLVFTSTDPQLVRHGAEAETITRDRRFGDYVYITRYASDRRPRYYEFLYLRSDLAKKVTLPGDDVETESGSGTRKEEPASYSMDGAESERQPSPGRFTGDGGSKLDSPERIWQFTRKESNPELKLAALKKLVDEYPDDPHVPEALWEINITVTDPGRRIDGFRRIADKYPDSDLAPKALFTIGFIHAEEMGNTVSAEKTFRELLEKYPESEMAESAKWMLENLGSEEPEFE